VFTPLRHDFAYLIHVPLDILPIYEIVGLAVPLSDPVPVVSAPMLVVGLVYPLNIRGFAGIVVTVLGILQCMEVQQHLNAVLMGSVQKPFNLFGGAVHAPDIGTILR